MRRSRLRPVLVLLALVLCACGSTGTPSGPGAGGDAKNAAAMVPLSDADDLVPPPGGAEAPRARARQPRTRSATAPELLAQPAAKPAYQPRAMPTATGPQIRVTWEALAVEKERLANPRIKRTQMIGLASQQKVVVVNAGHLEAKTSRLGAMSAQNRGTAVASVSDENMQRFLQLLERRGFFRHAKPTGAIARQFENERARGRITIERNGQSYSLVSLRGQGLDPRTKHIPALYSETKQAIMMLRNQTSCMGVVGIRGGVLTR